MMQEYNFASDGVTQMVDNIQPSEQVVKNILDFARSYQTIEVGDMQFDLFLN